MAGIEGILRNDQGSGFFEMEVAEHPTSIHLNLAPLEFSLLNSKTRKLFSAMFKGSFPGGSSESIKNFP